METEITKRVGTGWRNWSKCSGVLCDRRMAAKLKGKVYKTVIKPAMLDVGRNVGYNEETRKTDRGERDEDAIVDVQSEGTCVPAVYGLCAGTDVPVVCGLCVGTDVPAVCGLCVGTDVPAVCGLCVGTDVPAVCGLCVGTDVPVVCGLCVGTDVPAVCGLCVGTDVPPVCGLCVGTDVPAVCGLCVTLPVVCGLCVGTDRPAGCARCVVSRPVRPPVVLPPSLTPPAGPWLALTAPTTEKCAAPHPAGRAYSEALHLTGTT